MDRQVELLALQKLALGRANVMSRADYYGSTLLEMTPVIVEHPKLTMGITRGLVLYVNGTWLLSDPEVKEDDVVAACLVHECEHPLRGFDRLDALPDKELANIAGDIPINWNLREESWRLPSWVVYPETYGFKEGLTLEEHYDLLQKQLEQKKQSLQQLMDALSNQNGKGRGANKKKDGSQPEPPPGTWEPKVGGGACGSGAGRALDPLLEAALDAEYGKSPAEVEAVRRATLDDIERAAASGCGNVPGRFKELLKLRIARPDVNWRTILRRTLHRSIQLASGASDYSMRRPSIGGMLVGVYTAGCVGREVNIAIVEDTSMSMGAPQLQNARNEGYHLLRKAGVQEAWLIQSDTQVQEAKKIRIRELPHIAYNGRGGTDFRPVFEYVEKLRPRPNILVFFTDGDGPAPATPPRGIDVIWCIVRTAYARRPARWGHVVVCDKNQKLEDAYEVG